MALERLLTDGAAASAFLACLYVQEMEPLRCASPLARDCIDMYTEGKVLTLQSSASMDCFTMPLRHRRHMKDVHVYTSSRLAQLDTFDALSTLRAFVYDRSDKLFDLRAPPAWTRRVTTLVLARGIELVSSEHLAALPQLHQLAIPTLPDRQEEVFHISLSECKALRVLVITAEWARLIQTVPDGQLEHVYIEIDKFLHMARAGKIIERLCGVPHVTIYTNGLIFGVTHLSAARVVELDEITALDHFGKVLGQLANCTHLVLGVLEMQKSIPKFELPPRLTHFTLCGASRGGTTTFTPVPAAILDALRGVPHVTLKNLLLPPTWSATLGHAQTLSLVCSFFVQVPTAADWAALTSVQTLDLHTSSFHVDGRVQGLEELASLPRSARVRLSAQEMTPRWVKLLEDEYKWHEERDRATQMLFEKYGISAIPI